MKVLPAFIGVMILVSGAAYVVPVPEKEINPAKLVIETRTGKHTFDIEIADTPEKLERGLMFRESLPPDGGMLFEMGQEGIVSFWMKDTPMPLDMVFIGADGTIRNIHENAVPKSLESISSDVPVKAVLEINGGRTRALGIAAGNKVFHPYFTP
jgi:uncharacterized membrane protein (UPF0127 family)